MTMIMGWLIKFITSPIGQLFKYDKETAKVRVVFDASAKNGNEPSLNDCLDAGPCLLRQLYVILVQFRLTSPITKQFKMLFQINFTNSLGRSPTKRFIERVD